MSTTPAPAPPAYEYCDLVMKGGITSGVIYPSAAAKLASRYRFKNIGGTSAGAIAAAVVAAAEYGRRSGYAAAFDVLTKMPNSLASDGHLLKLFTPDKNTHKLFQVALNVMGAKTKLARIFKGIFGIILASPLISIPTFLVGLVTPALIFWGLSSQHLPILVSRHPWVCAISGIFTGLIFALIISGWFGGRAAIRALVANGFGLCSGMASQTGAGGSLTEWIDQQIQTAANRTDSDPAVTFGDLWHAKPYPGETLVTPNTINLEVVTTGLSDGRPFTIPFLSGAFYFDPAEWQHYFPARILATMAAAGERFERSENPRTPGITPTGNQRDVVSPTGAPLCRLPDSPDLPILIATRMSLSFPGLLSAVPLYRVDYRLLRNEPGKTNDPTRVANKVWFSDGGICSNFPISFFDSPIPRWPTFGINLQPADPDLCAATPRDPSRFVTLPPAAGAAPVFWTSLGDPTLKATGLAPALDPLTRIVSFAEAIMNTMQNWRDNLQVVAPGYRDRIVSVNLCNDEGGLNLNMPPELIAALSARGDFAAQLLTVPLYLPSGDKDPKAFDFPQHAFTRFRVSLSAIEDYLQQIDMGFGNPVPQDAEGWDYINGNKVPKHYYWHPDGLKGKAAQALVDLQQLVQSWEAELKQKEGFGTGVPKPKAPLQSRPEF